MLLICVIGLTLLGLTILFSASASYRDDSYFFIKRQLTWLGIAVVVGWLVSRTDLEWLRRFTWVIVGLALLGLVLVLIPGIGVMVNGSRRWIDLGPMRLQVSEFAKLAMVFGLAHYLAANQRLVPTFVRGFIVPLAGIALFAGLILVEPDFGTAFLTATIGLILIFLAGARLLHLAPTVLAGIAMFAAAILMNPVRLGRITSFLDVEGNRSDGAYQLWQAMLAFGAGGVEGVGLGNGRQQMAFLPEAHTDFIFAIVGEELGLIFTLLTVGLFVAVFIGGLLHVRRAPNLFHYLLINGCLLLISLQALINLGVVTGSLPTKGMSLPFISYGGSNLVLMAMIVGFVFNTRRAWDRPALARRARRLREVTA